MYRLLLYLFSIPETLPRTESTAAAASGSMREADDEVLWASLTCEKREPQQQRDRPQNLVVAGKPSTSDSSDGLVKTCRKLERLQALGGATQLQG